VELRFVGIFNTDRLDYIGESAVELVHAIQGNAAIDIGAFKVRIAPNCEIEIGKCRGNAAKPDLE
jgi:hypothetical protein